MPSLLDQSVVHLTWDEIRQRVHPSRPVRPPSRSPGWHLSGILRQAALDCGMLELGQVDAEDVELMPLRMILGMAFEEFVAGFYPDMEWQPGEVCRDAIYGTMDGLSPLDRGYRAPAWIRGHAEVVVDEFKLTWCSYRNHVENSGFMDRWLYMHQGMGYLNMLDAVYGERFSVVRYHVCYVNGKYDWKGKQNPDGEGLVPTYVKYTVGFSEEEKKRNWDLVMRYREKTEREV